MSEHLSDSCCFNMYFNTIGKYYCDKNVFSYPSSRWFNSNRWWRIYERVKVSRICNVPHVLLFWSFLQCVSLILVIPSSFHYQYITAHALLFFLLVCLGPLCKRRILFSFISNCSIFLARIAELFYFLYWLPDHCLSIIYSHWHKTLQCLYLPDIHFPCIKHVKENNKNLSKYSYLLFLVIFSYTSCKCQKAGICE